MTQTEVKELLNAGAHFGHLTRRWDPNMAPYIYMERNGIHILNLYKTAAKISEAQQALKKIALSGRNLSFIYFDESSIAHLIDSLENSTL